MGMILCWHGEYLVCGFRWATHGLDFLTSVCDPKFLAYLSNEEFEVRAGDLNEGHARCTGERPAKSVQFIEIFSMSEWKSRDGDEKLHTKSCVFTAPGAYMYICTYVTLPSEMSHINSLSHFRCTSDHPAKPVRFIEISVWMKIYSWQWKTSTQKLWVHSIRCIHYLCMYICDPTF